jgi:hypothetical protein
MPRIKKLWDLLFNHNSFDSDELLSRTRIQAEYLYGRKRTEFPDTEAHYIRDRSNRN